MSSTLHYVYPSLIGGLQVSLGGYILCAHMYQTQGQMLGHKGVEGSHLRGLLSERPTQYLSSCMASEPGPFGSHGRQS